MAEERRIAVKQGKEDKLEDDKEKKGKHPRQNRLQ